MAKLAKLTKLKSAIKRWPSLTKLTRTSSSVSSSSKQHEHEQQQQQQDLHAVYVGKSRRRYLVNAEVVQHPVFQELVDRSCCEDGAVVVSCEVVLFEHLLWMLESGGNETQLGSMDELVEFYNCGAC